MVKSLHTSTVFMCRSSGCLQRRVEDFGASFLNETRFEIQSAIKKRKYFKTLVLSCRTSSLTCSCLMGLVRAGSIEIYFDLTFMWLFVNCKICCCEYTTILGLFGGLFTGLRTRINGLKMANSIRHGLYCQDYILHR
jgi:hypothetical protein